MDLKSKEPNGFVCWGGQKSLLESEKEDQIVRK